MSDGVEFDCDDCSVHVHAFGIEAPPHPPRCATCISIRGMRDPEDRLALRQVLYDPEASEYWRTTGRYRDAERDERACDHCGKPYRGPAMYCSLACAMADA